MRDYFCGWYIKCQNDSRTVAFIASYHISDTEKSCSLQVIADSGAWNIVYPFDAFRQERDRICIGNNVFTKQGCLLDARDADITLSGSLDFGEFSPISYDIMGPFRFVPFLECRHSVYSMKHRVDGVIQINGEEFRFDNGVCYIEGDRGYSFPKHYLWTQCSFPEGSIIVSVADVPICGVHFNGVISAIHYLGKEYRIATYLGARVEKLRDGEIVIRQGNKRLTVKCLERRSHPLAAPTTGGMSRTIHESAACRVSYRLCENDKTVLDFESNRAAFEFEYPSVRQ